MILRNYSTITSDINKRRYIRNGYIWPLTNLSYTAIYSLALFSQEKSLCRAEITISLYLFLSLFHIHIAFFTVFSIARDVYLWKKNPFFPSIIVSTSPPVLLAMGMVPKNRPSIWMSPHGSNLDGTSKKSAEAYIWFARDESKLKIQETESG